MKDWVVKTPTLAVLCQTKERTPRGVAKEGLESSCLPGTPGSERGPGCWGSSLGPTLSLGL